MVQAARIAGAGLGVGVDPVRSRRNRAEKLGAAVVGGGEDGLERLRELTGGRGPDVVLCTVAAADGARVAFESLRQDGRMVTVAGFPPAGGEERKWVSGSWGCDQRLWPSVLEHLAARRFVVDDYVTHVLPLARIEEAFAIREQDLEGSFKVVVTTT
jgi:threonine dehydrogenase-like Zn-dependent dehydrogenase